MVNYVTSSRSSLGKVPKNQLFFPTRPGSVQVRFEANRIIRLTDEITGAFRDGVFYAALARVHERAALKVAEGMVESLQKSVRATGRPQRGSKALELSLLHENNRIYTASTFLVGVEKWLSRSPAKLYYRRIEEGDAKTFNSAPGTLFTTDFGNWSGPWRAGGRSSQSMARHQRSGGRTKLESRGMPGGYPHMRMIQRMGKGGQILGVGPYPAYQYSAGGQKVMRALPMADLYRTELAAHGIPVKVGAFK